MGFPKTFFLEKTEIVRCVVPKHVSGKSEIARCVFPKHFPGKSEIVRCVFPKHISRNIRKLFLGENTSRNLTFPGHSQGLPGNPVSSNTLEVPGNLRTTHILREFPRLSGIPGNSLGIPTTPMTFREFPGLGKVRL